MVQGNMKLVTRKLDDLNTVFDISGEVTSAAENQMTEAYNQATSSGTKNIILNFTGLDYMNSSGIGLLVTILIRAQRKNQRLLAYGLNQHYERIFDLTRLDEAIGIFENETEVLAAINEDRNGENRDNQSR
jgi:anti-sigma B factor antagonist